MTKTITIDPTDVRARAVVSTAEVPMNVNSDELGNLGLTAEEEQDLVVFLRTLTDGYQP